MPRTCKNCKYNFLPDVLFIAVLLLLLLLGFLLSFLAGLGGAKGGIHSFLSLTIVIAPPWPFSPSQLFDWLTHSASDGVTSIYQQIIAWLGRQGSILDFTDPAATYNNPSVREMWAVGLAIADSIIGIFIVLAGYRIVLGGFGARYTEALEEFPRLIASCVGANISLLFAGFWIDLNNLLCAVMLAQTANHPLSAFSALAIAIDLPIILPLLALLGFLIIFLGVQMTARLALILFLIPCLPVLFMLLSSNRTRNIGHAGINAYIATVLVQTLQLTCLTIGAKVLLPFINLNIGLTTALAPIATVLAGIGLFWVTLRIPSMLRHWSLQPIAESGEAARSIILTLAARRFF